MTMTTLTPGPHFIRSLIAASAAGLQGIPSLVNAIVITSAWSSSNQALLSGTRVLYGLALKKQAPQFFLKTTSWGVPYYCVLLQFAFMFLYLRASVVNAFANVLLYFANCLSRNV